MYWFGLTVSESECRLDSGSPITPSASTGGVHQGSLPPLHRPRCGSRICLRGGAAEILQTSRSGVAAAAKIWASKWEVGGAGSPGSPPRSAPASPYIYPHRCISLRWSPLPPRAPRLSLAGLGWIALTAVVFRIEFSHWICWILHVLSIDLSSIPHLNTMCLD